MAVRTLIVGGTFDQNGGRPSKIISILISAIPGAEVINGGKFCNLERLTEIIPNYDVVFWFPNVPNNLPKDLRDIKSRYPNKIVVTSKRNSAGEYQFSQLVNRALTLKSNLLLEFARNGDEVQGRIIDPLGACWCDYTNDFITIGSVLYQRLLDLCGFTRVPSVQVGPAIETLINPRFLELIKGYAEDFHRLINPEEGVTRFLGNASFRCTKGGFPSFRNGDLIFVSRRNIDKRCIDANGFVAVSANSSHPVRYYGDAKPSVDTPIQVRLYKLYPSVKYMLHAHTYIKGAPFSYRPIPCGCIEEVDEIRAVHPHDMANMCVNLIGHGSLVLAKDLDYMSSVTYIKRHVPEVIPTKKGD